MSDAPISFLSRFTRSNQAESPKALVLMGAFGVLSVVTLMVAAAVSIAILKGKLDAQGVALLVFLAGILGGLAGWHKQEDPKP